MSLSEKKSQVRFNLLIRNFLAFILKENGENIVKSLDHLLNKTEGLLKEGY